MPMRRDPIREARHRARRQLADLVSEIHEARLIAGLSQQQVAAAIGVSRQLISRWERGIGRPDQVQAAMWGAAVGLDVPVRSFVGGSPLRDAAQLSAIRRARAFIGPTWSWQTEVPVSPDPRDRRAIDAVLTRAGITIGLEVISRLVDAQAQVRRAMLKQEASKVDRMLLVLSETRHNRRAAAFAAPTLEPAFPILQRAILRAIRAGHLPPTNGLFFV